MKSTQKLVFLVFLILIISRTIVISQSFIPPSDYDEYAITNVDVIPMHRDVILKDYTVVVKAGKIKRIIPAERFRSNSNIMVIDGKGKYLVPGLAEMHAHIPVAIAGNDSLVKETLFLYLSNGITTIRGMLGDPYHLKLREQVKNGTILSPRIYTSSPSLNGNSVQTTTEAREKIRQYQKDGYDFLKIHPGITDEVFSAVVKNARNVGITFSGHVPADVGVYKAINYRYRSIDHLDGYITGLVPVTREIDRSQGGFFGYNFTGIADPRLVEVLAKTTAEAGVWIVPTQSLFTRWFSPKNSGALANEPEMQYMSPVTLFQWRQNKERLTSESGYNETLYKRYMLLRQNLIVGMYNAGVGLLLGSDAPQVFNVPGFSIQHEMQALAEAGLPNSAILQSGTLNPSLFFNEEGNFGTVVKGSSADLILLEGNPLEDIKNMSKIAGVMVRGQWLSREWIDKQLGQIAARYAEEVVEKTEN